MPGNYWRSALLGAEYYDTYVRSASTQFLIPAVLRVRMYVSAKEARTGRLTLSRRNIMLRDKCTCQCAPMLVLPPCYLCWIQRPCYMLHAIRYPAACTHAEQMYKYMRGRQTEYVWLVGWCSDATIAGTGLPVDRRGLVLRRYCGVRQNLTVDHVVPLSKGGKWAWENLVTACTRCNGQKARPPPTHAHAGPCLPFRRGWTLITWAEPEQVPKGVEGL